MGNAKYKIQNAKFRGAKRRIIMRNEVVRCQGSGEERCALIVQMANCKWQVASFGTLRVDFILS